MAAWPCQVASRGCLAPLAPPCRPRGALPAREAVVCQVAEVRQSVDVVAQPVEQQQQEEQQQQKRRRASRRNAAARRKAEEASAQQQQGEGDAPAQRALKARRDDADEQAAQQQQPTRGSPELEALLGKCTSRQEVLACVLLDLGRPLQPPELVFTCSTLAKMCEPATMNTRAWNDLEEGVLHLLKDSEGRLHELSSYELVVLLTALARTRTKPPAAWLERYFAASLPHLPTHGPGYLYMLLRSLGRLELTLWELKHIPTYRDWMHSLMAVSQSKVWAYRGDELVRTLTALSALGWRPRPEWIRTFSMAIKQRLEFLDPPLLSQALLALSQLREVPGAALSQAMGSQLSNKLPMFDDRELASVAQAMGLVKRMTTPEFFGDFMVEVGQKAHTFSPPALAHLLHALASLVEASHMAVLPPAQQQLLAQRQQRAAAFHARATDAPPPSPQQQQPEQQQHHHAAPQQRQQQQLVLSPPPFLPLTPVTAAAAVAPPHAQHALQHDGEPFTALQPLQQHHAQQQQLHQPPFGPGALQGAPSGGGDAGGSQGLVAAPAREEMAQRRQLAQAAAVLAEHLRPVFPDPSAAHHHQGHTQHSQHAQQQEQPQPRRRGGRAGGGAAAGGGGTSGAASSPSPPSPPPQAPGVRTPTLPAASPLWLQAISARVYAWITAPAAASAATAAAAPPSTAATARAPAPPAIHMEQAGMALRALAMLGHQLDAGRLDAFFAASLPLLKQGTAPSFLYLVQALAVSGYRPRTGDEAARFGEWLQALAQAAARRVYYSPAQVCDFVAALAALPAAPPPALVDALLAAMRRNRPNGLKNVSPARLARLAGALRVLRHRPEFGFVHAFGQAARYHWSNIEAKDLAGILCGLAAMRPSTLAVDSQWLGEMLLMVQCRLHRFDAPALGVLLAGVATLASDPARRRAQPGLEVWLPGEAWLESVYARLEEQVRGVSAPQAASILWSTATLAQLQQQQRQDLSHHLLVHDPLPQQQQQQPGRAGASLPLLMRLAACVGEGAGQLSAPQAQDVAWAVRALGLPLPAGLAQALRAEAAADEAAGGAAPAEQRARQRGGAAAGGKAPSGKPAAARRSGVPLEALAQSGNAGGGAAAAGGLPRLGALAEEQEAAGAREDGEEGVAAARGLRLQQQPQRHHHHELAVAMEPSAAAAAAWSLRTPAVVAAADVVEGPVAALQVAEGPRSYPVL